MIDHNTFGKLRLGAFLPGRELATLENWEFLDRLWVGEGCGFTSFLRLEDEPEVVRAIELDLATLTPTEAARIFKAIGLPL